MKEKLLEDIIEEIQQICPIYDIHFCQAGVGFVMYLGDGKEDDFKKNLQVEKYYPDIRTAAEKTLEHYENSTRNSYNR